MYSKCTILQYVGTKGPNVLVEHPNPEFSFAAMLSSDKYLHYTVSWNMVVRIWAYSAT